MYIALLVVILLLFIVVLYVNAISHQDNPTLCKYLVNNYRKIDQKFGIERYENIFTGS